MSLLRKIMIHYTEKLCLDNLVNFPLDENNVTEIWIGKTKRAAKTRWIFSSIYFLFFVTLSYLLYYFPFYSYPLFNLFLYYLCLFSVIYLKNSILFFITNHACGRFILIHIYKQITINLHSYFHIILLFSYPLFSYFKKSYFLPFLLVIHFKVFYWARQEYILWLDIIIDVCVCFYQDFGSESGRINVFWSNPKNQIRTGSGQNIPLKSNFS